MSVKRILTQAEKSLVVGSKVELLKDWKAYYSEYAGNPKVVIKAGMVGVIGATDVPYVYCTEDVSRGDYFVCVDFVLPGVFSGNPKFKQTTWRIGVNPKYVRLVTP